MFVRCLLLCSLVCGTAASASAAPVVQPTPEGFALENGRVRAFFAAGTNYVPTELRCLPDGANALDLCILSYSTEGAAYWFQDSKRGAFGLEPVAASTETGPGFARLTVRYPAAGAARHFGLTRTYTLREGSPVLECDYLLEAAETVPLRSDVAMPLVRFPTRFLAAAVPGADGSLSLGDVGAVRREAGAPVWVAACSRDRREGILFSCDDPNVQLRQESGFAAVSLPALAQARVPAGTRARVVFRLAPFAGPLPEALAAALAHVPGVPRPVRFERVNDMPTAHFDPADLSLWEKHRGDVRRPVALLKPADLQTARENLRRHRWAQDLLAAYRRRADEVLQQPAGTIEAMISGQTPLCTLFTMCPECETAPIHGRYAWSASDPDRLKCQGCGTLYPSAKYPEDLVLTTRWGGEQRFTFYGGKSWPFNGIGLRSSWSGAIRAYKNAHVASAARNLAIVYALTGERPYADKAAEILRRFAAVYPRYLLHSGYGEIADMDPRVAAAGINALPADETNCPPNKPDRKLHAGYWMAGRGFSAVGMEGTHILQLAEAYDLIADTLPDADRRRIEKDLLLEGTYLLLCDPGLNNKTATNRSAVGVVGMAVGDPQRVRFGRDGLRWFINTWFLPDGATSESPSYGNMTLGGIWRFADALHGYSDPPAYQADEGRLDGLDIYGDARYRSVFQVLADALLPTLTYPPIADSNLTAGLSLEIAEVMATRYPDARFRSLLQELAGGDLSRRRGEWALFHSPPEPTAPLPPAPLPDRFFPAWKIGILRSGTEGRRGAAVVSASDWGGHHHHDSLDLFYWQDGHELLSDLGYLWDNPDKHNLSRTVAHNLVVVDEQEQRAEGRGGWLRRFHVSPHAKVIEVASDAYAVARDYRRTLFLVDHPGGTYLVDIFRVAGGRKHDYVFHGPNPGVSLRGFEGEPAPDLAAYRFTGVQAARPVAAWRATWKLDDRVGFQAISMPHFGERAMVATGWGQRGAGEKGATLPYVVRRREASAEFFAPLMDPASAREVAERELESEFTTLFEGYRGAPLVRSAGRVSTGDPGVVLVVVDLADGGTDYLVSAPEGVEVGIATPAGSALLVEGGLAVVATRGRELRFATLVGGRSLEWADHRLVIETPVRRGKVVAHHNDGRDSWLELDAPLPDAAALVGQTLLAGLGEKRTGYEILGVEGTRVYVRRAGIGVDALAADNWELALSATLTAP